jgi:hypothetical protein
MFWLFAPNATFLLPETRALRNFQTKLSKIYQAPPHLAIIYLLANRSADTLSDGAVAG